MTGNEREYLGDGLYAEHDEYAYWLIAPMGPVREQRVCLEPDVLRAFLAYVERTSNVTITVTPNPPTT
jgi:hypothetical protein